MLSVFNGCYFDVVVAVVVVSFILRIMLPVTMKHVCHMQTSSTKLQKKKKNGNTKVNKQPV